MRYFRGFLDVASFQASELCPGIFFFNFTEMSVFLAFVSSHTQFFSDCNVRYFVVLVGHGATSEPVFTINSGGSEGMLAHAGSGRLL